MGFSLTIGALMLDKIIWIGGRAGCGKSTLANWLGEELIKRGCVVHRLAFGDLLKDYLGSLLKCDFKANDSLKYDSIVFNGEVISVRHCMQALGDVVRSINKGVFCREVHNKAKKLKGVLIVDDVRFFNEAMSLVGISRALRIVFLNGEGFGLPMHASEDAVGLKRSVMNYFNSVKNCKISEWEGYKTRGSKDNAVILDFVLS